MFKGAVTHDKGGVLFCPQRRRQTIGAVLSAENGESFIAIRNFFAKPIRARKNIAPGQAVRPTASGVTPNSFLRGQVASSNSGLCILGWDRHSFCVGKQNDQN